MCGYLLLKFRENDKKLEKTYKIFEISINSKGNLLLRSTVLLFKFSKIVTKFSNLRINFNPQIIYRFIDDYPQKFSKRINM